MEYFGGAPTKNIVENMNESIESTESDSEDERNNSPPPDVPKELRDNIQNIKYLLYKNIVLSPELGTKDAQNPKLIDEYLDKLNTVYILSTKATNGVRLNSAKLNLVDSLTTFPADTQDIIQKTLKWIYTFFKKNQIHNTIPCSAYIKYSLKENQFKQDEDLFKDE